MVLIDIRFLRSLELSSNCLELSGNNKNISKDLIASC